MHIVYNHHHQLHHGQNELMDGQLVPCFEKPQRLTYIVK